jgi:phosphopantothenoylcysteine decarboxylase / phosphopantothenate---cysteine ligase
LLLGSRMHPSHVIRGRATQLLKGRKIVVGVTGSIAAVEVPRIIRELIRHGAEVRAVMSPEASRILSVEALEFATGHPVISQLTGNVEHVTQLGPGEGRADLYLIAPATANTIGKVAHGIDDTPVTSFASVALGGRVPMLLAPAMHANMGASPAVKENLEKLASWGVGIIHGNAAEGEEKIASPEETAAAVLHRIVRGPWNAQLVVVVGGASRESIDSVRAVTNESSGATAVALANQAYYRGAEVELWAGAVEVPIPTWIPVERWRSVADLLALARKQHARLASARAVFVPAALSDFTLDVHSGKIPSREHPTLTLTLHRAPKVLPELRRLAGPPAILVAFKLLADAPPAELEARARELGHEVRADWVVANDAAVMGSDSTNSLIVPPRGDRRWIRGAKSDFAGKLLDDIGRETVDWTAPGSGPPSAATRAVRHRPRRPRRPASGRRS